MTNTGFTTPGTGANNADAGTQAWANPTRITADDASNSATAALKAGQTSQYLHGTNFGFAISAGATIDGIVARVQRFANGTGVTDHTIQLIVAGTRSGDNKADAVTNWPTTTPTNADYGSSSDKWGLTLTQTDVNDSTFGLAVRASCGTSSRIPSVDVIWLDIYYTDPAVGHGLTMSVKLEKRRLV